VAGLDRFADRLALRALLSYLLATAADSTERQRYRRSKDRRSHEWLLVPARKAPASTELALLLTVVTTKALADMAARLSEIIQIAPPAPAPAGWFGFAGIEGQAPAPGEVRCRRRPGMWWSITSGRGVAPVVSIVIGVAGVRLVVLRVPIVVAASHLPTLRQLDATHGGAL
jgi:hypothetical protein